MTSNIAEIGGFKVKSLPNGELVELKSFWQNQDVVVVFFRRWGCLLCRLWAKELAEIQPVLDKHDIKLIGVGVEEIGSKEFIEGKFFTGDLYCVEKQSTYQSLGFKKFNTFSILTSLLWKQSRDAIHKGKSMGIHTDLVGDGLQNGGAVLVRKGGNLLCHFIQYGPADRMPNKDILEVYFPISITLGGDLRGDWGQVGGALVVKKGGNLLEHFVQTGPGDHLSNFDILKLFGVESEYKPDTMANKERDDVKCEIEKKP